MYNPFQCLQKLYVSVLLNVLAIQLLRGTDKEWVDGNLQLLKNIRVFMGGGGGYHIKFCSLCNWTTIYKRCNR